MQRTTKLWNACKEVFPQEVAEANYGQFLLGLFTKDEGVIDTKWSQILAGS